MERSSNFVRRPHGLRPPFSTEQYIAWTTLAASVLIFGCFVAPFLPHQWLFPVVCAYVGIFLVGTSAYLHVSLVDPADTRKAVSDQAAVNRCCYTCGSGMPYRTKHCRICNKCVPSFDHHCLYLNTCIGKNNYWSFFILVTSVSLLMAIQLSASIFIVLVNQSNNEVVTAINDSIFRRRDVYLSLVMSTAIVPLISFLAVMSLLLFHVYIWFLGATTYEWIMGQREPKPVPMTTLQSAQPIDLEREARQQEIYDDWLKERNRRAAGEERDRSHLRPPTMFSQADPSVLEKSNRYVRSNMPADAKGVVELDDVDLEPQYRRNSLSMARSESESMVYEVLGIADVRLIGDGDSRRSLGASLAVGRAEEGKGSPDKPETLDKSPTDEDKAVEGL